MVSLVAAAAAKPAAPASPEHQTVRDTLWFSGLYEETVDTVYRYAYVLVRSAERAEDVTADVFLKAWRNRSSLRSEQSAHAWLMTIARNSAMSFLRASRDNVDLDAISEPRDEAADPCGELIAEFDVNRLQDALHQLTTEQQQVVFLRFFEGLSHEAVAQRLGSNANAIRAIQFRALARLRKLLQEDFVATAS